MTPSQLRQHAAVRFTSVNKHDWCDAAVAAMRHAADVIERMDQSAASPTIKESLTVQAPATGKQSLQVQPENSNGNARPASETAPPVSPAQGGVDARSVGNNSLDRGGVDAGDQGSRNPAEPDSGVPDARTGGSSGLVAKRPTPSKPEGSSIDRAVRTLMDRTNGN